MPSSAVHQAAHELVEWAQLEAPQECCGLIAEIDDQRRLFPIHNVAAEPKIRFELNARGQYEAEMAVKGAGGKILGTYHSHPNGAAYPSPLDLELLSKLPELWHSIISLRDDEPVIGSYLIRGGRIVHGHIHTLEA